MNFQKYSKDIRQQGFIKWILVIIVAVVIASYFFDFSVQDAVEDEQTQENFGYISENVQSFWNEHLADPANYLWNDVFLGLIWSAFTSNMENLQNGEETIFDTSAPGVDLGTVIGNVGGVARVKDMVNEISNITTASSVVNKPITAGLSGKAKEYVDTVTEHIEINE